VDIMAILESLQSDIAETGGQVDLEGAPLKPWTGRAQAIKRCLKNLVENAVKYGTRATVAIDDDNERLMIVVRDEGPGIPENELEQVFEPFHRLEGSRNRDSGGTGLGLTIARGVAQSHGGSLNLHNRVEGGLEARLILPRHPPA
jgi:signal transduction histidine kinase